MGLGANRSKKHWEEARLRMGIGLLFALTVCKLEVSSVLNCAGISGKRHDLSLLLKLECSGITIARCNFELLGSRDPTSASRIAGTTGLAPNKLSHVANPLRW
ncbi:uncharacterized protein C9orf85-like isoform X2 [Eulemur rufifrons]|uniref:uncharacterized protein C9orf85-like isoform X2 n=1 Tax=Eulemur rufifrons TaxID=859984 RepID=UPI0037437F87